ncbi:MAG: PQQ-binding-like beta-propeller repeat protein [Pseudomonadota bacterium]
MREPRSEEVEGRDGSAWGARMAHMSRVLGLGVLVMLAACNDPEVILTGKRENIRDILTEGDTQTALAEQAQTGEIPPLSLPPTRNNASWSQAIASPITRPAHPQFSSQPRLLWSVDIGEGDGKKSRITADPVVADGSVFTLDAQTQVSAVTTSGQVLWTKDLTPENDDSSEGSGGGLAYDGGVVYVSSGFGSLTAFDAATGAQIWRQNLQATATGSPSVAGDLVYIVAGDQLAWAIERDNGRIRWQLSATNDRRNVLGAPAPSISDEFVVFAFGSGEVQGAFRNGGLRLWDAQIAGRRAGFSSGLVADITGDPIIVGDRVFVGSHAGRTVALNLGNGERVWTAPDGPLNPIWPAGNSLFMVSDRNELLRLSAADGRRIWGVTLPFFIKDKPRRQSEIFAHHGPIVASGRLILVSNDGFMRFFDPETGRTLGQLEMPDGATTNPVVANGTLYVVTTKGELLAYR